MVRNTTANIKKTVNYVNFARSINISTLNEISTFHLFPSMVHNPNYI